MKKENKWLLQRIGQIENADPMEQARRASMDEKLKSVKLI
jgi:hypothetical protein